LDLCTLKRLNYLRIRGTKITDKGLTKLATLSLLTLDVQDTAITDVGLRELKGMMSLRTLYLGGTQVTDSGIQELVGLTNLQRLEVSSTKVTENGKRAIKAALPNLMFIEPQGKPKAK
jgi:Leucine-rich repeat (LRR) protein